MVDIDEDAMKATLAREYTHPDRLLSEAQGSVQTLPLGNVFVGWGSAPVFSEFSHDGELSFSAAFPSEVESYRTFRFPWKGEPRERPAVVAETGPENRVTVYASWNCATEVATWQVLAGTGPNKLRPLDSTPRQGFETVITVHTTDPYVGLKAINGSGRVLGFTRTIKLEPNA